MTAYRSRALAGFTWVYVVWSLLPVLIAVLFSFNAGRSRSVWQGFSLRWWIGDPNASLLHDDSLRMTTVNSLVLAVVTVVVTLPLGTMLAIGLQRW
ncbi:MAG: ABC transporter permease, partial [Actinomycetota bacterium]